MSCSSDRPRVYVYVAGPYTTGDVVQNVRAAVSAANEIANMGAFPFIPHLSHFWHYLYIQPYTFWMAQDKAWLEQCDILYRLPGYSEGGDDEVRHAQSLGIPVVHGNFGRLQAEIERIRIRKSQEKTQEAQDVV